MKTHCPECGNRLTPTQVKEQIKPEKIRHSHDGKILESMAIRYNDAFYEITQGTHKGNLVHIWNIVK